MNGKARALIISFRSSHSAPEERRSLTAAVCEIPNSCITIFINLICSGSRRTEIKVLLSINNPLINNISTSRISNSQNLKNIIKFKKTNF